MKRYTMLHYNNENPTNPAWTRTAWSIVVEWVAHNGAYYLNVQRDRTGDVDLDNNDEGKTIFDFIMGAF